MPIKEFVISVQSGMIPLLVKIYEGSYAAILIYANLDASKTDNLFIGKSATANSIIFSKIFSKSLSLWKFFKGNLFIPIILTMIWIGFYRNVVCLYHFMIEQKSLMLVVLVILTPIKCRDYEPSVISKVCVWLNDKENNLRYKLVLLDYSLLNLLVWYRLFLNFSFKCVDRNHLATHSFILDPLYQLSLQVFLEWYIL